ncbi:MAG: fibronectin type III domain-containing protein [Chloroflexi bacterium]|nr:fibronectin type III domain-containing protein [Chloroflexota bacterium]
MAVAVVGALAFSLVLGASLAAPAQATVTVDLSGVVSDASGPVSGTSVWFGGGSQVSTVTGADGSYVLHVLPGDTGLLEFDASSSTAAPLSRLTARQNSYTIGSGPVVANLVWPAHAQVRTTVVDAIPTPLPDVVVHRLNAGEIQGTLSDGTAITFSSDYPYSEDSCTTDAAGQCTFSTLVGATPGFYATYQLVPGDPSYPNFYVYSYPLITADPTDATISFLNVASFESAGSVVGPVVVSAPDGTSFSGVKNEVVAGNALPSGATVLTGELSYQLDGLAPGSAIDVTLLLPSGSSPTSVIKLEGGIYTDVSSIATFAGAAITLHLTDGGFGDSDGLANGIIVDPVIPVIPVAPGAPTIGQATGASASASVAFTAPAIDGGSPVLDYTTTCTSSNGGTSGSSTGGASPLLVAGLTNGRSYTCIVVARNGVGTGPPSATSNSFTPAAALNQTIKFNSLGNKSMTQSPVTVSATASSGLLVTFTTSTSSVCTASGATGATITLVGLGTCTVIAHQPGNSTYNPAPTVSQSFRVR